MKKAATVVRRLGVAGAVEIGADRLVIRLPEMAFLRVIARSALLAIAILALPWLRSALLSSAGVEAPRSPAAGTEAAFADLRRHGLLRPGDRAVFLGDRGMKIQVFEQSGIDLVSGDRMPEIPAGSVDFVFSGDVFAVGLDSVDRALKIGGVAAIRLDSDPRIAAFRPLANYRIAYFRRIAGASVVAMRKSGDGILTGSQRRRLVAVPEAKKEAINGLKDALLEPPEKGSRCRRRPWHLPPYLPEVMGDSLTDVGPAWRDASEVDWFARHYPTRDVDFELIPVDEVSPPATPRRSVAPAVGRGMAEWLEMDVREEEFVVMKAEAEVVEKRRGQEPNGLLGVPPSLWEIKGPRSCRPPIGPSTESQTIKKS